MHLAILGTLLPLTFVAAIGPAGAADAGPGQAVFEAQCSACHSFDPDETKNGPTLKGVAGRKSGAIASYDYSGAMSSAGVVWDAPTLDTYLKNPQAKVPGTKMLFPGLAADRDRSDLIAYLSTQN